MRLNGKTRRVREAKNLRDATLTEERSFPANSKHIEDGLQPANNTYYSARDEKGLEEINPKAFDWV